MSKKPLKVPVMVNQDGVSFIKVKMIMHPLIAYMGEFPISTFKGSSDVWMTVNDAIKWCENEKPYAGKNSPDYDAIIAKLLDILQEEALLPVEQNHV